MPALTLGGIVVLLFLLKVGCGPIRRWPNVPEACCASCRYPTQGLAGARTCPECGSDLEDNGTLRPGEMMRRYPPRAVAIFCRTALVIMTALLVISSAARVEEWPEILIASATAASGAGLFRSVEVRGIGSEGLAGYSDERGATPRPGTIAILYGPKRSITLRVTDAATRAVYDSSGGRVRTADALTEDDILAWMGHAGVDTASAAAHQEARAVAALIRNVAVGGGALELASPSGVFLGLRSVNISIEWRYAFQSLVVGVGSIAAIFIWGLLIRQVLRWPSKPVSARSRPSTPANSAHSPPRSPS
jgi:hypothetical protein